MRSWQFFLVVAVTIGAMSYFYYNSDYYAKRVAGTADRPTAAVIAPVETVPASAASRQESSRSKVNLP
jgi:hypothetical protein